MNSCLRRACFVMLGVSILGAACIGQEHPEKRPAPAAAGATTPFGRIEEGRVSADEERYECRKGTEQFLPKSEGFAWKMMPFEQMPQYEAFAVTFPSPVESPYPENNTVYAEYYRSVGKQGFPGVIVLHILAGDFELARILCRHLAGQGIGALFVQMAYYGNRRPKDGRRPRMISEDIDMTLAAVKQTVMDIRRAGVWLSLRPEVDSKKVGVTGISLGAFIAALSAGIEPRFRRCGLVLGGGDIAEVIWNGRETAKHRKRLEDRGFTLESLSEKLRDVEPLEYARNIDPRGVLMANALNDDVVPPSCTEKLWEAMGKPKIFWYNCNHYTMITYIFGVLAKLSEHFDGTKWEMEREKRNG